MLADVSVYEHKVRHSQSVHPWVAAKRCGIIVCLHCTCRLSQLTWQLYCLTYNRLNKEVSCTSQACTWLPPANMQNVKYAPINFTAPLTKRNNITSGKPVHQSQRQLLIVLRNVSIFLHNLSKQGTLHCYQNILMHTCMTIVQCLNFY